jgi:hypothetical protein
LASIHGRINILKYLIEEKNFDPNYPSNHGWRPVHLCISNQIGLRAIECLNYLVEQGAELNVKNNDGVYPIVMEIFIYSLLYSQLPEDPAFSTRYYRCYLSFFLKVVPGNNCSQKILFGPKKRTYYRDNLQDFLFFNLFS